MTMLLASVAAVSLLVGGIGIMNIMLVSVTERTREIGIRMAVGAKPHNILIAVPDRGARRSPSPAASSASRWASARRYGLPHGLQWPMLIQPDVIAVSVGFSALVGIVFGLYPARKASQLDPIDALRFE